MLLGGQGGKLSTCAIRPAAIYGVDLFPRVVPLSAQTIPILGARQLES